MASNSAGYFPSRSRIRYFTPGTRHPAPGIVEVHEQVPGRLGDVIGPDALLLGLPALVEVAQGHPPSWTTVLVQAVVG
jgi:hypothetical protein